MNYDYRLDVATPPLANVINLIAPDGNFFPFSKQPDGTLINTSDPAMSGAVMTVNGTDVELRWKDSTKFEFQRQLSSLGQPIEVLNATIDPNGNQTTVVRTGIQISDIFDPVGRRFHFDYDSGNHITQITDPIGRQVKYSYKSMQVAAIFVDLLEDVTDPNGGNTHYIYDSLARLVSVTDPRGVVLFTNTYDPTSGRVIKQVSAEGGGVFNFAYTFANPQAPGISPILETDVTDPLGNVTIYRFNPQGYPIQVTDPLGQTRILDRDGNNKIVSLTGNGSCDVCRNPELGDRSFTYDANGNPLTATDALGNTTRFTYDPVFNKVTSITDPLGNVTQFAYNLRGNLLSTTDPNGHTTSFAYSPFGELISIVDASGQNTTLGYDSFGNPVSVTDALGNTTSIAYDAVSRPIQTVDALGRKTTTAYDTLDRVVAQTNAQNNQTQFAYDAVANLLSVTDAKGSTTSFTYDSLNRLLMRRDPLGKSDTRTYDLNGNLTKFVDRRGQISQFIYDALDRLAGETYPDATVGRSYDANGRLIYANDSAGSAFAFTYDAMGHPTSSTSPFGSVQYTRDADGRVTSRQVAGQAALAYSYDPAGNLLSAALPQASAIFAYNARNKLTSLARANGITSQYAYDNDGRLLSITDSAGSGTLNSQTYVYDPVGNRSMHTTNIAQPLITQAVSNTYDAANRLVQSVANGTTTLYTYDANGNLTSATGSTGTTIYTWDGRNRLATVSMPGGQTTNFQYDFRGNLITQTDTGSVLNLIQNFVLDDRTNLAYIDRSNGDSISVLAGRSIDQHLAVVHSSGQAEYGLTNAINSTTATVDQTGAPLSRFFYEPFGRTTTDSSYPFQYAGLIPMTGSLYSFRARYYDSTAGRFVGEDPISFLGKDVNLYRYVTGDPISLVDPIGLLSWRERTIRKLDEDAKRLAEDGYIFDAFILQTKSTELSALGLLPGPLGDVVDVVDIYTDPCKRTSLGAYAFKLATFGVGKYFESSKFAYSFFSGRGLSHSEITGGARALQKNIKEIAPFFDIGSYFLHDDSSQ